MATTLIQLQLYASCVNQVYQVASSVRLTRLAFNAKADITFQVASVKHVPMPIARSVTLPLHPTASLAILVTISMATYAILVFKQVV